MSLPLDLNHLDFAYNLALEYNPNVKRTIEFAQKANKFRKTPIGKTAIRIAKRTKTGSKVQKKWNSKMHRVQHVGTHTRQVAKGLLALDKTLKSMEPTARNARYLSKAKKLSSMISESAETIMPFAEAAAEYAPLLLI